MNYKLKFNKIAIITILSNLHALNIGAYAKDSPQAYGNFQNSIGSGPYIGVGAGLTIAHYTNGILSDNTPQTFSLHMNKFSPAMNIIAGYAYRINNWHLGIEADYMIQNINASFAQSIGNNSRIARIKSGNAIGGAFRFGYHCDRLLTYVRLGVENRSFHVIANSFGLTSARVARNTIDYKTRKTAFTPGIGLQFAMNKNLSASFEYRIALYNKLSTSLFSQVDQNKTSFSIKPLVSSVMVSLRYHF
jgi:opacity protein-like surface antigen